MGSSEIQTVMSKIVTQFTAAVQNAGIYPDDHPQVRSYIQETNRLLEELFQWKKAMTLLLIGDSLMVEKKPLTIAGAYETALLHILKDNEIERVTFSKGLSLAELVNLSELFHRRSFGEAFHPAHQVRKAREQGS